MLKKLFVGAFGAILSVAGVSGNTTKISTRQDALIELRDNNCVNCHARLSTPLRLTSRYADWYMSTNLDSVRRKADDAFEMGTKVKDSLRAKLYPQQ